MMKCICGHGCRNEMANKQPACGLVPLADDLHGVFLSRLLVCATSANGKASLSQNAVPQVHLITHVEGRILQRQSACLVKLTFFFFFFKLSCLYCNKMLLLERWNDLNEL